MTKVLKKILHPKMKTMTMIYRNTKKVVQKILHPLTKVQFEFFQTDNETELYTLILNEEEQAIFLKAINCLIK